MKAFKFSQVIDTLAVDFGKIQVYMTVVVSFLFQLVGATVSLKYVSTN
jgi:hypothetical protein